MNTSPEAVGLAWIWHKLANDAGVVALVGGNVFRTAVPPQTGDPYVLVSFMTGQNTMAKASKRVMATVTYLVKGVAQENDSLASQIADAIDGALDDCYEQFSTLPSWQIESQQEAPYRQCQAINGRYFHQIGGRYQVTVRKIHS